jgi:hypothetical protein
VRVHRRQYTLGSLMAAIAAIAVALAYPEATVYLVLAFQGPMILIVVLLFILAFVAALRMLCLLTLAAVYHLFGSLTSRIPRPARPLIRSSPEAEERGPD